MKFPLDRLPQLIFSVIATLPLIACNTPTVSLPTPSPTPTQASGADALRSVGDQRTVTDYFLQAPEQYFKMLDRDSVGVDVRQRLLQTQPRTGTPIVDTANGYIRTPSLSPDLCAYEMAIFRRSQGSHLVALNVTCTMGDTLTILDPDRNWENVTAKVLPLKLEPSPEVTIRLPRQGRTIEVMGENHQLIAQVKFDNDRFVVVK
jgi:hypothetical protein